MLADRDDALLEKVLEDVKPTTAEIYTDLRKDLAAGAVVEVLLGSAENAGGVRRLWKALRHDTPMARETAERKGIDAEGPPLGADLQDGACGTYRQAVLRADLARLDQGWRNAGRHAAGRHLSDAWRRTGEGRRGRRGRNRRVGAARRRGDRRHRVAGRDAGRSWRSPPHPTPVYSLAIATSDHKDDAKLSGALQKQREADPTLTMEQTQDTGETVLYGQGEMHLNSTVDRLARDYGLKVATPASAGGLQGDDPPRGP